MATRPSGANDLTGQRFGQLVVTGQATPSIFGDRSPRWRCKCDCGRKTAISEVSLLEQETPTCGYRHSKRSSPKQRTSMDKLRKVWSAMKDRCENPNNPSYHNYGGRGITVCEEWRNSFQTFADDMGPKPTPDHTIERVDNSGPYSPSNCTWATRAEQARNKRTNRLIFYNGREMCLDDWIEETGIPHATLHYRLFSASPPWPVEKALTTPPDDTALIVSFKGRTQPLTQWAEELEISYDRLHSRIYSSGMTIEEAFTTPVATRTSRVIEFNGKAQSVQAWAKELGIPHKLLAKRIYERGWSVERALTEPVEEATVYEFNGEQLTIVEWSKKLGIPKRTLYSRLHDHGWSIEKTLTEPTEKGPSFEFEGKRLSLKDISRETGIPYRTLGYRVLTKGMAIKDAIADRRR